VTHKKLPESFIKDVQSEYTERRVNEEKADKASVRVGHFFLNTETNTLYVCTGRINGSPVWSEVKRERI
jgi:hypothetical protein